MRICAAVTLLIAAVILAFSFAIELIDEKFTLLSVLDGKTMEGSNLSILEGCAAYFVDGFNAIFKTAVELPASLAGGVFYTSSADIGYGAVAVVPVAFTVFVLLAFVVLIQSVVRLCTGRAGKAGAIVGLVMLLAVVALIIGAVLTAAHLEADIAEAALTDGIIAFAALSAAATVAAFVAGTGKKSQTKGGELI